MENNKYKKLEEKAWYRFLKVLGWLILILSFLAPTLADFHIFSPDKAAGWFFDGVVNLMFWYFILLMIRKAIYYITFGSKNNEK